MVALNETTSELRPRRISRGCRVTAEYPQGGTGIPAGEMNYPGAAAQSRCLGTGFCAVDATSGFGLSPNALNINGDNTYQFVESDPVDYADPSGDIAWYYWAGAGVVDVLGGGPEDPIADGFILGAGEAAARAAAQQAMEQSLAESAAKAASIAARLALLHAMAAAKDGSGPKANAGARGGSCSASGSPQKPKPGSEGVRQKLARMRREPPPAELHRRNPMAPRFGIQTAQVVAGSTTTATWFHLTRAASRAPTGTSRTREPVVTLNCPPPKLGST